MLRDRWQARKEVTYTTIQTPKMTTKKDKPQIYLAVTFHSGHHYLNTMGAIRAKEEWDVFIIYAVFYIKLNILSLS